MKVASILFNIIQMINSKNFKFVELSSLYTKETLGRIAGKIITVKLRGSNAVITVFVHAISGTLLKVSETNIFGDLIEGVHAVSYIHLEALIPNEDVAQNETSVKYEF